MAEFTRDQLDEIEEGKKSAVNIAMYDRPEFLAIQMRQIRRGLEAGLAVSWYADPSFDWFQMDEIRQGLSQKVDVSSYADATIPYEKMHQIRKGLLKGIDISSEASTHSAGVLKQIRKSREEKLDIDSFVEQGYDSEQLYQIRLALKANLDLTPYIATDFRGAAIAEIRHGLADDVDVTKYADIKYSWLQMRQLRMGLENRLDISLYSNPYYDWKQMREIRLGLMDGLDVSQYRSLMYTNREMKKRRLKLRNGELLVEKVFGDEDYEIHVSGGGADAFIRILEHAPVTTAERIHEILGENGITKGIIEESVQDIVNGNYSNEPIHIAQGKVPKKGADGYYEFFFNTDNIKKPEILPDGSVDYSNVNWFTVVSAGDVLAVYHPAEDGEDGYGVDGTELKAKKGIERMILKGSGYILSEDKLTYTSEIDGMVTLKGDILEVSRHMELNEVTMASGNVDFDGSIHVKGNVETGTVIHATEDIVIDGNVGGAEIISEGKIILNKGMNAGRRGKVKAAKGVVSKFFENVIVVSDADIEVNISMNSVMRAGGRIICKRELIGGRAFASRGFKLSAAGNETGTPTQLQLGIDQGVLDRMGELKDKLAENKKQLRILEHSREEMKVKFPPEVRNAMDTFVKIENAIFTISKKNESIEREREALNREVLYSRESTIAISGTAFEGVSCMVHRGKWEANGEKNVVLKAEGNLVKVTNG